MGGQLQPVSITHAINRFNRIKGVDITSVHAFRRTFAKNFILSGGDVCHLQRWLGHSCLEMSRRYASLYDTDLQKEFEQYNLLEKLHKGRSKISLGKRK